MKINYLIIHHSAVSRTKNPDQFVANNNYHKEKWNFKSSLGFYLGYHYEIAANGTIRQARAENEPGAHTIGHNDDSIGICIDGEFDTELPTLEQVKSLTKLLLELKGCYPSAKIAYHRQFANKTCPGKLIADNWANNLILNNNTMINPVEGAILKLYPEGNIVQRFGVNGYFYNPLAGHSGYDIQCLKRKKVFAPDAGDIIQSGKLAHGNQITLQAKGMRYIFGHFDEIVVWANAKVKKGDLIGYAGNTGMEMATPGSIFAAQMNAMWKKAPSVDFTHVHFQASPTDDNGALLYPNNGYGGAVPFLDNLINQSKQNTMIYAIDKNQDQWIVEPMLKIAFSIADGPELAAIKAGNPQLTAFLSGTSQAVDLTGYVIYRGGTEKRIKDFFNFK